MKTFKSFLQLDELTGVAPKSKGEHKFVHSTYLAQIKDPGDLEKVGPEEIGPHDTKLASGKRSADRLDNKQKFGESIDLEENYRSLAQKGIGAERKEDIKVGHGVDYYHPKTGDKHMGKIHSMSDKGYVVKDDKTGEKHSFDYFRKEEVELEGAELDEDEYKGKRYGHTGIKIKSEKHYNQLVQADKDRAEKRRKEDQETGKNDRKPGMTKQEYEKQHKELQAKHKEHQRKIDMGHYGESVDHEESLDEASYTGKGNHRPGWMLRADPELAKKFKEKEELAKKRQAAYGNPAAGKSVKEESELEEADFSKAQTKMAHTIGKYFKKKGVGDESKGGPFAVASAMVRDKPETAKKAYATIKAKMKNEDHQDMLMALYDELSEENQEIFESMLDSQPERLLSFAQSHFAGE